MLRFHARSGAPARMLFAAATAPALLHARRMQSSGGNGAGNKSPPPPPSEEDDAADAAAQLFEKDFSAAVGAIDSDRSDVCITAPTLAELDQGPWYVITRRPDKNLIAATIDIEQGKRLLTAYGGFGVQLPVDHAADDGNVVRIFSVPERLGWSISQNEAGADAATPRPGNQNDAQAIPTVSDEHMRAVAESVRKAKARERRNAPVFEGKLGETKQVSGRTPWKKVYNDETLSQLAMAQVATWFSSGSIQEVQSKTGKTILRDKTTGDAIFRSYNLTREKRLANYRARTKSSEPRLMLRDFEGGEIIPRANPQPPRAASEAKKAKLAAKPAAKPASASTAKPAAKSKTRRA